MRIDLRSRVVAVALLAVLARPVCPAQAQHSPADGRGSDPRDTARHDHDFHGRDYNHFTPDERRAWSGGHWEHSWHDNRLAWWWTVGGGWYSYPSPIYPFPTYVPLIAAQQPAPDGLPPTQFWYFCDNPRGYYPYTASCNGPWREVPAIPPR